MRSQIILPALLLISAASHLLFAQGGGRGDAPPLAPKAAAPIDLTGYWVSVVDEDWRWRMVTPAKGDYASIPITPAAMKVADGWDPAKDQATGEQCRSYGAPAIMRVPGRLHITWQDDNTLKVETDAGEQTRLLHFGTWKGSTGPASWQGDSRAEWQTPVPPGGGNGGGGNAVPQAPAKTGSLKVITTRIRPGYLRKNGVPYSANATLTEYWDLAVEKHLSQKFNGEQIITVTTVVDDPMYLQVPWLTSLHFKKEADGAKWDPQPCNAKW